MKKENFNSVKPAWEETKEEKEKRKDKEKERLDKNKNKKGNDKK